MRLSVTRVRGVAGCTTAVAAVLLLSGCIFDRLQQSDQRDIQRVEQKQAALQAEQARATTLTQREEELAGELERQEMSVDELNRRVQQINAENGRGITDERAAGLQYRDLLVQLHDTSQQLALAGRGTDTDSVEARHERISSLKAQLRTQLDLLLRK